jgi:hypothetical protein
MTTLTKTRRANGLGLKKDLKNVTPATSKAVEKKAVNETKEEVKKTSSVLTAKEENSKVEEQQKPIVETPVPTPPPVPELTLEQKIEKVENLKLLIEKREILEESRKKLNAFVIGSPNFGENIKLTDEEGNTFQTSNTEVFTKVVATIKETLIEKIKEIETEIKF